ncbi:hypothetical protein [Nocardioides yefusunii]|uniref:hypothetical protein n=1 Tax=Nocardioides yefusunii TaxID=2500546 RepID=UPI000FE32E7E|nr:hypothetical protein [Nocardioides yefusunii]
MSRVVRSVGPAAATVHVRLESLAHLPDVESAWPGARVVDRWTVTAPLKRDGRRLAPTVASPPFPRERRV